MRARGWLFLLAAILVAKINGVLLMSGICLYWQNSVNTTMGIYACVGQPLESNSAHPGQAPCPTWASVVPHMGKRRAHFKPESVVRACLYFVFLEECILFGF